MDAPPGFRRSDTAWWKHSQELSFRLFSARPEFRPRLHVFVLTASDHQDRLPFDCTSSAAPFRSAGTPQKSEPADRTRNCGWRAWKKFWFCSVSAISGQNLTLFPAEGSCSSAVAKISANSEHFLMQIRYIRTTQYRCRNVTLCLLVAPRRAVKHMTSHLKENTPAWTIAGTAQTWTYGAVSGLPGSEQASTCFPAASLWKPLLFLHGRNHSSC